METMTRTSLFDIYPELAKAPLPSDVAGSVGSPASTTGGNVNWLVLILLATTGIGAYFFIKWQEERRKENVY